MYMCASQKHSPFDSLFNWKRSANNKVQAAAAAAVHCERAFK